MKRLTHLLAVAVAFSTFPLSHTASAQDAGDSVCCDTDTVFSDCGSCGACGDWLSQPFMLGDLHGARSGLAQHGILYNASLTQFYQGVASGGTEQHFEYGGKLDQFVTLQGQPYGLEGFMAVMHVETRYGEDVITSAGATSPSNVAMLYPKLGSDETAITGLFFQQALNERIALTAGKYQAVDLIDMVTHGGRGVEGFMNTSLVLLPTTLMRTTELSFVGGGLLVMEGREVQGALLVYDTKNVATTSGLDDLFDNGAVILGLWRFFTEMNGKPGYHMFGGNYSSGDYTSTDPAGFTIIPGQGLVADEVTGSWSLFYVFNQQLWADPCNANRNLSFTSQFGLADDNPNAIHWAATAAIEGRGVISGREQDRFGVGYFFQGLSGNMKDLVGPLVPLQDLHGVELYYNAALTPWFHLTADLQIVDPARERSDTAIIPGLRANLVF